MKNPYDIIWVCYFLIMPFVIWFISTCEWSQFEIFRIPFNAISLFIFFITGIILYLCAKKRENKIWDSKLPKEYQSKKKQKH